MSMASNTGSDARLASSLQEQVPTDWLKNYEIGRWAITSLGTATGWPSIDQTIEFVGDRFSLIPQRAMLYPAVAVKVAAGVPYAEGWTKNNRFLSMLSWATGFAYGDPRHSGSSRYPMPFGGFTLPAPRFSSSYGEHGLYLRKPLPSVNLDQSMVLAFWREGRNMEIEEYESHYAFVSYYKIMERAIAPNKRSEFIQSAIQKLSDVTTSYGERAREHAHRLATQGIDPGNYIRRQCRDYAAHGGAGGDALDPDNVQHTRRLWEATPIMKSLAHLLMIEHYDLPSPQSF